VKKVLLSCLLLIFLADSPAKADEMRIWEILTDEGVYLTSICEEPSAGDEYISAENVLYEIVSVSGNQAVSAKKGMVELPSLSWMDADAAMPVSTSAQRIALYCTHSDESYEPSDGFYSTTERGSIYQVGQALAEALQDEGIEVSFADTLHHPHDAGAYRRSRQTAVQLLKQGMPDCLIDIHRDGIPDPDSYAVTIGGEEASKIRILVGRGNQNAAVNKEFALMVKAVADRVYPGLIKDIYLGKGTFNQDLLPQSILLECGTYTLPKERVLRSMPRMADVLNRALYGGVVGSVSRISSDADAMPKVTGGIVEGAPDVPQHEDGVFGGFGFLLALLLIGILGFAMLSAGSLKRGMHKAARGVHEMTGGLIGKKPEDGEEHQHS